MPQVFTKDPDDVLDYQIDWTNWLGGTSPEDTISTSAWTVESGIVNDADVISTDLKKAIITLSGGTVGQRYTLTNRIVTTGGRTKDGTIYITVRESN